MRLLGLLGVGICVAATIVVWFTGARLRHANEKVFDAIDKPLAATRDRVLRARTRVQDLKITAEDVRQGVEDWARRKAAEDLTARLGVQEKAERLAAGLEQADRWLEVSGASLQGIQHVLEIRGGSPSADDANADGLLERLEAARRQLEESTEAVGAILERLSQSAEETLGERLTRLAQLAVRVFATLGDIDTRLGHLADRLAATQARGEDLQRRTDTYIVASQIGAVLLIVWMAAGQVSLWRHGR